MLTANDFISLYEGYSNEELYKAYSTIGDYSEQAQEALKDAIQKRGGLEKIIEEHNYQLRIANEKERIRQETAQLYVSDSNVAFLKNLITSDLISPSELHQIIESKYLELRSEEEDKKIKPRTIFGSLIGGLIGSVIGGVLWGLQMIQMHRVFFILIAGLIIISYGLIRAFTKQSKANTAVVIATFLSVAGSVLIGQVLFEIFG
jgi:hypothetical protein